MTRTEYLAVHAHPTPSALPHGGSYRTLSDAPARSILEDRLGRILIKDSERFRYIAAPGGVKVPPEYQRWYHLEPVDGPFRLVRMARSEDLEIPHGS